MEKFRRLFKYVTAREDKPPFVTLETYVGLGHFIPRSQLPAGVWEKISEDIRTRKPQWEKVLALLDPTRKLIGFSYTYASHFSQFCYMAVYEEPASQNATAVTFHKDGVSGKPAVLEYGWASNDKRIIRFEDTGKEE